MSISNKGYINNSSTCPICGGEDLTNFYEDMFGGMIYYTSKCFGCFSTWTDVYKLERIDELTDGNTGNEIVVDYD
jgi:hypothetical protein